MSESQAIAAPGLKRKNLGELPVKGIVESKLNPRKTFTDMDDLQASVAARGVLTPLLVRAGTHGTYELIAGARRLRAAIAAGVRTVPAVEILDCDDAAAAELQIIENCQRADVHPMEEAEAYEALAQAMPCEYTIRLNALASKVGKPRSTIAKRLRLLALPKAAREAFKAGAIGAEIANLIARIPKPKDREKAAKFATTETEIGLRDARTIDVRALPPIESVAAWIEKHLERSLKDASFDPTDVTLVPKAGACGPCPKRIGNQGDLFAGAGNEDVCTDGACFQLKGDAAWKRLAAAAIKDGKEVLADAAAKKAFPWHGQLRDGRFVDADADHYHAGKYIKARSLVKGQKLKEVIARKPDGSIATLYHAKEFVAAEKKLTPADRKKESHQNLMDGKTRAGIKARKIELEAKRRLKVDLIKKVRAGASDRAFLIAVAPLLVPDAVCTYSSQNDKAIWKAYEARSRKAILEIKDMHVLKAAILDHGLGDPGKNHMGDIHMAAAGAALGLDLKDYVAAVKAEKKAPKPKAARK